MPQPEPESQPEVVDDPSGRQARIAELEASLGSRPRFGVRAPTAIFGLVFSFGLLWMMAPDLRYFFSPRSPQILGREGEYAVDSIRPNRYVQVHGIPTLRGTYSLAKDDAFVIVGLRESPFLLRRAPFPNEVWTAGQPPPQPDQRPFAVGGRLMNESQAHHYADAFKRFREMGEVNPHRGQLYLIIDGERPEQFLVLVFCAALLLLFAAANGFFLYRAIEFRFRRKG